MNKTVQHKKAILDALEQSLGVVTSACKKVGIGRTTYYGWLSDDADFKKAVDEIQEVAIDFAESQLHKQIKGGSTAATIFYLKTKGKKRGYIEKTETETFLNLNENFDIKDIFKVGKSK
jgi:DNA-binding NtrC family response regulator